MFEQDDFFDGTESDLPNEDVPDIPHELTTLEKLELLIDGELGEAERKSLLLQLDQTKNGWKQCALLFLESQLLEQTIKYDAIKKKLQTNEPYFVGQRNTPSQQSQTRQMMPSANTPPSYLSSPRSWQSMLPLLMACFWVAFALGAIAFSVFDLQKETPQVFYPLPQLVDNNIESTVAPQYLNAGDESLHAQPFLMPNLTPISVHGAKPTTEYVSIPCMSGTIRQSGLPCYRCKDIDAIQYLNTPQPISQRNLSRIQQMGGEVNIHRHHLIVPVDEKRQVIIPIDQVYVKYRPEAKLL